MQRAISMRPRRLTRTRANEQRSEWSECGRAAYPPTTWRTVTRLQSIKCVRLLWLMHYEAIKNGNYSSALCSRPRARARTLGNRTTFHVGRVRTRCWMHCSRYNARRYADDTRSHSKTHPDPPRRLAATGVRFAAIFSRRPTTLPIFITRSSRVHSRTRARWGINRAPLKRIINSPRYFVEIWTLILATLFSLAPDSLRIQILNCFEFFFTHDTRNRWRGSEAPRDRFVKMTSGLSGNPVNKKGAGKGETRWEGFRRGNDRVARGKKERNGNPFLFPVCPCAEPRKLPWKFDSKNIRLMEFLRFFRPRSLYSPTPFLSFSLSLSLFCLPTLGRRASAIWPARER